MAAGVDTYVDGGLDPDLAHDYCVGAYNSAGPVNRDRTRKSGQVQYSQNSIFMAPFFAENLAVFGASTLGFTEGQPFPASFACFSLIGQSYPVTLTASPDGTQNLQQVTLSFPHPAGESFTVKVTSSDTTEDDLWDPAIPGATGTPGTLALGTDASGNVLDSYTFTTDPNAQSKTFLVGATKGDWRMFVLQYYFNGIENTDTSTPTFLGEQESGLLGPTGPTGPVRAQSNDGEDLSVSIKLNTHPNTDPNANGVDKPYNWLVGQTVDLTAVVTGPPPDLANSTFTWEVPGNVQSAYTTTATTATVTSLASTRTLEGVCPPNQTVTGEVDLPMKFFWVSTDYDPSVDGEGPDLDTVAVHIIPKGPVPIRGAAVNFNVYSPQPTNQLIVPGVIRSADFPAPESGIGRKTRNWGLFNDPNLPSPLPDKKPFVDQYGIFQGGDVATKQPVGNNRCFALGSFKFLQLVTPKNSFIVSGVGRHSKVYNVTGLDLYQPLKAIGRQFDNAGRDGYVTGQGPKYINDAPDFPLEGLEAPPSTNVHDSRPTWSQIAADETFQTYMTYRPPGAGAQWVPLLIDNWSIHFGLLRKNPGPTPVPGSAGDYTGDLWRLTYGAPNIPKTFARAVTEPEWSIVIDGADARP